MLHIVHLEDHHLYQLGMQSALNSIQPNLSFRSFRHPYAALQYTAIALARKIEINLIITDFSQVSANGYVFASQVRHLEKSRGRHITIPILLLSMLEPEGEPLIPLGLRKGLFSTYLSKKSIPKEILIAINQLINGNN